MSCAHVHVYSYCLFEQITFYIRNMNKVFLLCVGVHVHVYSYSLFEQMTFYIRNMNKVVLLCVHVHVYSYYLFEQMTFCIRSKNKVVLLSAHVHVYSYSLFEQMTSTLGTWIMLFSCVHTIMSIIPYLWIWLATVRFARVFSYVHMPIRIPYIHIFPGLTLTTFQSLISHGTVAVL